MNYADYMITFELLYKDLDSLEVSNLDTRNSFEKNLPKAEFDASKIFLKNKDIIVQKRIRVIQSSF